MIQNPFMQPRVDVRRRQLEDLRERVRRRARWISRFQGLLLATMLCGLILSNWWLVIGMVEDTLTREASYSRLTADSWPVAGVITWAACLVGVGALALLVVIDWRDGKASDRNLVEALRLSGTLDACGARMQRRKRATRPEASPPYVTVESEASKARCTAAA